MFGFLDGAAEEEAEEPMRFRRSGWRSSSGTSSLSPAAARRRTGASCSGTSGSSSRRRNSRGAAGSRSATRYRVTVAAQACVLLLHRETDDFPRLRSIVVYPAGYLARTVKPVGAGMVAEGEEARLGEAWGPRAAGALAGRCARRTRRARGPGSERRPGRVRARARTPRTARRTARRRSIRGPAAAPTGRACPARPTRGCGATWSAAASPILDDDRRGKSRRVLRRGDGVLLRNRPWTCRSSGRNCDGKRAGVLSAGPGELDGGRRTIDGAATMDDRR